MRSGLFKIPAMAILVILMIGFTNGIQYVRNPNFSSHTSISDIDSWWVFDPDGENFEERLTTNDWNLVPYGELIESSSPAYFLSLNYQCVIQLIPELPAGEYEYSTQFYLSSQISNGEISGVVYSYILSYYQQALLAFLTYRPSALGQNIVLSQRFTLNTEIRNVYSLVCASGPTNKLYFTNILLNGNPFPPAISNCQTQKTVGSQKVCLACKSGYVLDINATSCISAVTYCSDYKNGKCSICIEGYFLNNNGCFRLSAECQKTDAKGFCTQCQPGFSVVDGQCLKNIPIPTCTSSQFLSSENICVQGNVYKCENYISPSGQCASCEVNYKLNMMNQCVFTCPPNTETHKYVQRKRECIMTDINCNLVNDDGSCAVCNEGFYAVNDRCFSLKSSIQLTVDSTTQDKEQVTEQIKSDESGSKYSARADGTRLYLSGPWTNLQVQADGSNNLYVDLANGGRQYLTGPYERLYAYQDATDRWYVIDSQGKKVYI